MMDFVTMWRLAEKGQSNKAMNALRFSLAPRSAETHKRISACSTMMLFQYVMRRISFTRPSSTPNASKVAYLVLSLISNNGFPAFLSHA